MFIQEDQTIARMDDNLIKKSKNKQRSFSSHEKQKIILKWMHHLVIKASQSEKKTNPRHYVMQVRQDSLFSKKKR